MSKKDKKRDKRNRKTLRKALRIIDKDPGAAGGCLANELTMMVYKKIGHLLFDKKK